MKVGNKIREVRKKLGLNMKEIAQRVGVSYLTIYRVETDKTSPSVALLSDIAHQLGQPIATFIDEKKKLTIVKARTAPTIESGKMKLELLIPKGVIDEKISVSLGESQGGEFVSKHSHEGFELTYEVKGKALFRYENEEHEINEGDLLFFNSGVEHSVTALEPVKFLTIYFRE